MMLVARIKGLGFLEWAGIASLVDTILTYDVKQQAFALVVEFAAKGAGIQLDENDPFSDASFSGALTQKTGIPIRSIKDRAMLEEDIDNYAAGRLSQAIGFQVSSLRDPAKAREDLERAAVLILAEKTGIPFALGDGGLDPVQIKEQVKDWARAQLAAEFSGSAGAALAALSGEGVDFEALVAEVNGKMVALGSGESISANSLALHVADSLVKSSIAKLHTTAVGMSKKSRRSIQLREAQRKFRSTHGNRQKYIPLGMGAVIG